MVIVHPKTRDESRQGIEI